MNSFDAREMPFSENVLKVTEEFYSLMRLLEQRVVSFREEQCRLFIEDAQNCGLVLADPEEDTFLCSTCGRYTGCLCRVYKLDKMLCWDCLLESGRSWDDSGDWHALCGSYRVIAKDRPATGITFKDGGLCPTDLSAFVQRWSRNRSEPTSFEPAVLHTMEKELEMYRAKGARLHGIELAFSDSDLFASVTEPETSELDDQKIEISMGPMIASDATTVSGQFLEPDETDSGYVAKRSPDFEYVPGRDCDSENI